MSWDDFGFIQQDLSLRRNGRVRSTRWRLAWTVALVALALAAGVSIAAGDLDWDGTPPQNVSDSPTNNVWQPSIAAGPAGQVVIAWSDKESVWEDAQRQVYVRRSDDNGSTWSAPEVMSTTAHVSALPDACTVGGQAFVAWVDQSSIGGLNVALYEAEVGGGSARRIQSPTSLNFTQPRLAAGGDSLHVAFNAGPHILHAMRPLAATAWPMATRAYTSTATLGPWFPALAVGSEGEALHMVWREVDGEWAGQWIKEWKIMYGRGEVHGADVSWAPVLPLSEGDTELFYPDIAADSAGNLYVIWGEVAGAGALEDQDQYIRYTRYDVTSGEWISPSVRVDGDPVRVNQDNPTYTAPSLAVREQDGRVEICVVWHGFRTGEFGEQILVSCSSDRGQSWSTPRDVSRNADPDEISIEPDVAFDKLGRLHCVWQEHTSDMGDNVIYDYEVFYARAMSKMYMPFFARGAE